MRKVAITALLLSLFYLPKAQITEKITVKAGEDLSTAVSSHGLYKFPDFIYGTVIFRDGNTTKAKMNFNVFLNDMLFIDNKNDTLAIDNPELIDSIKLDSNVFYYQKGYFYIMKNGVENKLVMQEKIDFENIKKGAYGLPARGASIDTYGGAASSFNSINKYILNEDIVIKKEALYILIYKKFRQTPANLKGFLTAFPEIKEQVQSFVEANHISFKNEGDIIKLYQFCIAHSL